MKSIKILAVMMVTTGLWACKSAATDGQINQMCENKLKISGTLRGTSYEEESKRISDEYQKKEDALKEEMERDLKGMDDVLAGRLKELPDDDKIAAAKEDIEKKKKGITDQFEPLIAKLHPQKAYALKDAKEYTDKRAAEAEKAKADCLEDAKKTKVTEETALCRIQADSPDKYNACP